MMRLINFKAIMLCVDNNLILISVDTSNALSPDYEGNQPMLHHRSMC